MILFVVDQIAGAEYIYPLLCRWRERGFVDWRVVCSAVSARFFEKRSIDYLELSNPETSDVERLLDEYHPSNAVLSSSGASLLEEYFLNELRKRGVPSCQFIDNWVNYAVRYEKKNSEGEIHRVYPDRILTLDDKAKEEMISANIPSDIIEIVGQPYFEHCMCSPENGVVKVFDSTLLVTQPISRHYGRSLGYDEKLFVSACLETWKRLNNDWSKMNVLVHPSEDIESYAELVSDYTDEVKLLRMSECNLRRYSLVIGMFSSMMIQSVLAGIDTVSFQPGACGDDMSFLSRYGYINRIVTQDGLYDYLSNYVGSDAADFDKYDELRSSLKGSCDRFENAIMSHFQHGGG